MSDRLNKTIECRDGEVLDTQVIDSVMRQHIDNLTGDPEIRQFPGGQSNLTYSVIYGDRAFVLRRPPFGTKPKSGHSMIREYRVMNALRPVFAQVPETFFHMPDEGSPLGAEFYVMAQVQGLKPGRNFPADLTIDVKAARQLGFDFVDKLIALHRVDYQAIGLGDFGKPEGYVKRQIEGWNSRWSRALTDDVEPFEDVTTWLADNMPAREVGHSIVHGDYRLDNLILDPKSLSIRAILDWEISALGDPLMDLGNTLAYWIEDSDPAEVQSLRMQPSNHLGMPTRAEIADYYGKQTGLNMDNFSYYLVYGVFRLAVILQQIYYRYYHGQTKNPAFAGFAGQVNILGNHARRLIGTA